MRWRAPRNLGWKAGSVLLAFLLWAMMSAEPDVVTTHTTPILYQNLPADYLVGGVGVPDTVRIELRGPSGQLTPGLLSDTALLVDLGRTSGRGDRTITVSQAQLNLPRGVTFLRAEPSQFRVHLARLTTRQVPVRIQLVGTLPSGLKLKSSIANPSTMQVVGAEERVARVIDVETDPIDLSEIRQSNDYRVNAFVPDSRVRFTSDPTVTVTVDVEVMTPKQ